MGISKFESEPEGPREKFETRISKFEREPEEPKEKFETRISKTDKEPQQSTSYEKAGEQKKKYDLEERTEKFSIRVRDFCVRLKRDIINMEYIRQLVRSAGSVAANYIEANENLGEGDLKYRIKVCRKESKESRLWLKHALTGGDVTLEQEKAQLIQEAFELENIFASILKKLIWKEESKSRPKL